MRMISIAGVLILLIGAIVFTPFAQGIPCEDDPECIPTQTPTPTASPTPYEIDEPDPEPDAGPPYGSDGRLNPDAGEYYTLYCAYDTLHIYRGTPESLLLKQVEIADLLSLSVGATLDLGDFMTAVRHSEDIFTIYGSNGNTAPDYGQKSFSMAECIARNGGAPTVAPTNTPRPSGGDDDDDDEETDAEHRIRERQEAQENLEFCFESYEFFGGDTELLLDCLGFAAELPGTSSIEQLWIIIWSICAGTPIFGVGMIPVILHRRRKRRR
ncbi:MAG: hypothetical protein IPM16_19650 [Chloroflexi bacterium]|nr:hypothetical protein [Chloroflexota bacterium]